MAAPASALFNSRIDRTERKPAHVMPTQLSILIVNWRSKDYLRRCLGTVRQTCADLAPQIVVVDGGSFDGCGEMLAKEFPEVVFVQSPENIGFGRSNNLGFEKVTGELLLLLNPDTELQPGSIQTLITAISSLSAPGILCPRLLNTDGTLQKSCVMALPTPLNQALRSEFLMRLFPKSSLWGAAEAFSATSPVAVEAVSGACMLLYSKTFRQLGGFDPRFFMYGEDMDLCARVRKLGLKIYHIPGSTVIHHGGASSGTQPSQFSTITMRSANERYIRLNVGKAPAFAYRLLQGLSAIVRMAIAAPCLLFVVAGIHARAKFSLTRWWYVLKWSLGLAN